MYFTHSKRTGVQTMKVAGIIAEYNPLHNGHAYHIRKVKELTKADYVIVVMSGNFTQRGIPALMDKYSRAKMALKAGADLVLELPLCYSSGSAEYFASGAVALLDKLGMVDCICFGSECADIRILTEIADILIEKEDLLSEQIRAQMKQGLTYPQARAQAIGALIPNAYAHVDAMSYPNNILGFEYIKALKRRNSTIVPYTNQRIGSGYHDRMVTDGMSSALSIRQSLLENNSLEMLETSVPDYVFTAMQKNYGKNFPVYHDDISSILKYKLLLEESKGYTEYLDISEDFSAKIAKNLKKYRNFTQFCELLKSKDITYARVSRCLLHILLNLKKEDLEKYVANDYIFYARILGIRKDATELSSAMKEKSSIPIISKLADAKKNLSPLGMEMLESDILAAHIYDSIVAEKFNAKPTNEFTREIVTE